MDTKLADVRVYEDPNRPGVTVVEQGTTFANGYRVSVKWSEEDASWIAQCEGMKAFVPGYAFAMHPTSQMLALAELACVLASTIDCFGSVLDGVTDGAVEP